MGLEKCLFMIKKAWQVPLGKRINMISSSLGGYAQLQYVGTHLNTLADTGLSNAEGNKQTTWRARVRSSFRLAFSYNTEDSASKTVDWKLNPVACTLFLPKSILGFLINLSQMAVDTVCAIYPWQGITEAKPEQRVKGSYGRDITRTTSRAERIIKIFNTKSRPLCSLNLDYRARIWQIFPVIPLIFFEKFFKYPFETLVNFHDVLTLGDFIDLIRSFSKHEIGRVHATMVGVAYTGKLFFDALILFLGFTYLSTTYFSIGASALEVSLQALEMINVLEITPFLVEIFGFSPELSGLLVLGLGASGCQLGNTLLYRQGFCMSEMRRLRSALSVKVDYSSHQPR